MVLPGIGLRTARDARGLTIRAAAEELGVGRLHLDLLERDQVVPSPQLVARIEEVLVVDDATLDGLRVMSRQWRPKPARSVPPNVCRVVTLGRRSGVEREKEWHWFVMHGGFGPCFLEPAGRRANWIRNLVANPRVRLEVDDGIFHGWAYIAVGDEADDVRDRFRTKYPGYDGVVHELVGVGLPIVAVDDSRLGAELMARTPHERAAGYTRG